MTIITVYISCYYVPGTTVSIDYLTCNFKTALLDRYYHHPHFTNEETGTEQLSNLPRVTQLVY